MHGGVQERGENKAKFRQYVLTDGAGMISIAISFGVSGAIL